MIEIMDHTSNCILTASLISLLRGLLPILPLVCCRKQPSRFAENILSYTFLILQFINFFLTYL